MKKFKKRTQETGGSVIEGVFGSLLEVMGEARMSHSENLSASTLEEIFL